ncbi:MAG: hypothetical protein A2451_02480, partial [Bdellovibrionales bacterium RIFOXYC2_FULL_39_8]
AGPAGLFCALHLLEHGIKSIVVDRGDRAALRMNYIAKFWKHGQLDANTNVCFGEGGAGLFSDGKLVTRIKSPHIQYVMKKMAQFGAPAEIEFLANPHLGSNRMRAIITKLTNYLIEKGCLFRFNTQVINILHSNHSISGVELKNGEKLFSPQVVLATGHSARDTYTMLYEQQVEMAAKDFAVGVRIEHPRALIDKLQYGRFAGHARLETARYRLSHFNKKSARGTYSFCMCPGGYVLSAGTEEMGLVTNGMSNFAQNSPWSNAAIVVATQKEKDFTGNNVLGGIAFQKGIEKKAYELSQQFASGRELPAMRLLDFLEGKIIGEGQVKTSSPSSVFLTDISKIFPNFVNAHLKEAFVQFNKDLPGFIDKSAILIAPETRTSSPVTILRNKETLVSTNIAGLYPCGEGAGYAGGITSAAVDGVNVASSIVQAHLLAGNQFV